MRRRILSLIKMNRAIIIYLVFGVMTTAVNYLVFYPCYNYFGISAFASNVIAWFAAVIFAFVTNKPFVFGSHDWSMKTVIPELVSFFGTRIASGAMESLMVGCAERFGWNVNLWKVIISVLVVAVNYFGSRFLVFRRKK